MQVDFSEPKFEEAKRGIVLLLFGDTKGTCLFFRTKIRVGKQVEVWFFKKKEWVASYTNVATMAH